MSSSSRQGKSSNKCDIARTDAERRLPSQASHANANHTCTDYMELNEILGELRKIRGENQEGHWNQSLPWQTGTVSRGLEKPTCDTWGKTKRGRKENQHSGRYGHRHERTLRYLLHREMELTDRCEDLQNKLRRNNIRIYQVPKCSEGQDMIGSVKDLIAGILNETPEWAHRAPPHRPKDSTASPRSILVKSYDFTVKDAVLRKVWSQKQITFRDILIMTTRPNFRAGERATQNKLGDGREDLPDADARCPGTKGARSDVPYWVERLFGERVERRQVDAERSRTGKRFLTLTLWLHSTVQSENYKH